MSPAFQQRPCLKDVLFFRLQKSQALCFFFRFACSTIAGALSSSEDDIGPKLGVWWLMSRFNRSSQSKQVRKP